MILNISPKFPQNKINDLFKKLDTNKNGVIQKKQFLRIVEEGLITQKGYDGVWK